MKSHYLNKQNENCLMLLLEAI